MRKRTASRRRRGGVLIEAMVSLGILAVGSTAVINLMGHIRTANSRASFLSASLNLFGAFSAQVRAAGCDHPNPANAGTAIQFLSATADTGLAIGNHVNQALGSAIDLVGDFEGARKILDAPPMRLTYTVEDLTPVGTNSPPVLAIAVRIREIRRDAVLDAAVDGYWIREFTVMKNCAIRTETVVTCGQNACGRGEFAP
jgi:type II secretory pathway pseudopilin PulG